MGRIFYISFGILSFLLAVFLYLFFDLDYFYVISFLLFALFLMLFSILIKQKNLKRLFFVSGFLIFAFFLGFLRSLLTEPNINNSKISFYNDNYLCYEAVVIDVDLRQNSAKYTVKTKKLSDNGLSVSGKVLLTLSKYPNYKYGDLLSVCGEIEAPAVFDKFNYANYLSRYNIYSVSYKPNVNVLDHKQASSLLYIIYKFKENFLYKINYLFPEPYSSFEAGLLVGARKGISDDLMEKFNITGLTHIIAISGYNISIIIIFVMWFLAFLPRTVSFKIAIITIILFTIFVGASPAVVRASIMGILGLIALNFGRQSNINLSILWTAFFMILYNPKILWWDVGFQLSFSAVLGLIYISPLFDKYVEKLPQKFAIRESVQMTLSAQVFAIPIMVYNFERLSLVSVLSNLLVSFAIPIAMLFGFIAVVLSLISNTLALFFAYIATAFLKYIIVVVELTAKVPYASVDIKDLNFLVLIVYYILLFLLLYFYRKKKKRI